MKKSVLLTFALMLLGLTACSNNAALSSVPSDDEQQTITEAAESETSGELEETEEPEVFDENLGVFNKSAVLEETVLVDENGVKITATGLNYTNYSVELELVIENNSDKNLSFNSGTLGYSCNSANGYMVNDGYLNCDVAAGKKANEEISFGYDGLMLYGINEIADMEVGFTISDEDYNRTYTGPCQLKTSVFDSHDYSKNHYQSTITSEAAMNTYGYDIKHFSEDIHYEESGIKIVSDSVIVNRDGKTMLLLELENTTENMVYMAISDIALNGLVINSSLWSSDAINPGKHGIIDVELSDVLDSEYWSVYGIEEIGMISLSLSQLDSEGTEIVEAVPIEIAIPDANMKYDVSGIELYNKDGVRIVEKAILEDPSEYSADINILLLVENNSGKALTIDDEYDSLSINGFMSDYSCPNVEIKDGQSAVLNIHLWESALEDNKISGVADVKEVEISFEIKEGYSVFDSPMVKIEAEEE